MTVKAVLFDLDDTLLWDERSVDEAFQATCQVAAQEAGVDPARLEEVVRREARALYESYETYPFTVNIGINPSKDCGGKFEAGEDEHLPAAAHRSALPPVPMPGRGASRSGRR